jgi:hypothetical protein
VAAGRETIDAYATTNLANASFAVLLIPNLDISDGFHYPAETRLLSRRKNRLFRQSARFRIFSHDFKLN